MMRRCSLLLLVRATFVNEMAELLKLKSKSKSKLKFAVAEVVEEARLLDAESGEREVEGVDGEMPVKAVRRRRREFIGCRGLRRGIVVDLLIRR